MNQQSGSRSGPDSGPDLALTAHFFNNMHETDVDENWPVDLGSWFLILVVSYVVSHHFYLLSQFSASL